MHLEFNGSKIIVDELDNKDYPLLNGKESGIDEPVLWTFPSKEILDGVKELLLSKYTQLEQIFFHLILDIGGGDEVGLNIHCSAMSSHRARIRSVSGWIDARLDNYEILSVEEIMKHVHELFEVLSYSVHLYNKTKMRLDADDKLHEYDLKKLKNLGFNVNDQGHLSEEDLDKIEQLRLEGKF